MIATIHQPEYLPWLGYFDRLLKSDIFIILDHVQYQRGFINRNNIKTAEGRQWISIPIKKHMNRLPINKVLINNEINWQNELLKTLYYNYSKAPFYKKNIKIIEDAISKKWELISLLDTYLIKKIMNLLEIKTKIFFSSEMDLQGRATDLLINICKKVNANIYLSGMLGPRYMEIEKFSKEKIKVLFQKYNHPVYKQLFNKQGFIPQLSVIDLIFNYGESAKDIVRNKHL